MRYFLGIFFCALSLMSFSQQADWVFSASVRTPQLFLYGNQVEYPVLRLGSNEKLELHFDDIDGNVKNYFYTYQLCNADWTPAIISQFDYIRGFSQVRISLYRFSSIALTKYTHYQAIVPDVNCIPTRSGNYLLKVFLDGDTAKLAFTRRFLVVEDGASIAAQSLQPFDPAKTYTHQKIQLVVNTGKLNITNAFQQVKVVLLQNDRWDNALYNVRPTFYSGNTFQYNSDDDCTFPAGKQWRWVDIQSFRFQSDRILRADYLKTSTTIYMKPDLDRSRLPYIFFNDINGLFYIQTTESINPLWQTDYASVIFNFVPPDKAPFNDKDVYIIGKFTDFAYNDMTKLNFNGEKGVYETTLLMKQGYYNYEYVTVDKADPNRVPSFEFTEGNSFETENEYTILVYYRQLGDRSDKLVGMARMNTMNNR